MKRRLAALVIQARRAAGRVNASATDLTALGGLAAITYGVDLVYHPAAYIVGGAFAVASCWLIARSAG